MRQGSLLVKRKVAAVLVRADLGKTTLDVGAVFCERRREFQGVGNRGVEVECLRNVVHEL